jgi:penicillin-insensitive murein endopeptidase
MKPERGRNFGHPTLVAFIDSLGKAAAGRGLGKLGVGDLGQARGGPAPNGHASHQNGLDVDLWFSAGDKPDAEQESMVDLEAKVVNGAFGPRASSLLELSAKDPRVARIFVHAAIKKRLCETTEGDRRWLGKLRPWYGHHEHFHVRLACPEGSPECQPQPPVPAGDDCDGVDWWLSDETAADRDKGVSKYANRIKEKPKLPASCDEVIARPAVKVPSGK